MKLIINEGGETLEQVNYPDSPSLMTYTVIPVIGDSIVLIKGTPPKHTIYVVLDRSITYDPHYPEAHQIIILIVKQLD